MSLTRIPLAGKAELMRLLRMDMWEVRVPSIISAEVASADTASPSDPEAGSR